jgi:hypothetical protein
MRADRLVCIILWGTFHYMQFVRSRQQGTENSSSSGLTSRSEIVSASRTAAGCAGSQQTGPVRADGERAIAGLPQWSLLALLSSAGRRLRSLVTASS